MPFRQPNPRLRMLMRMRVIKRTVLLRKRLLIRRRRMVSRARRMYPQKIHPTQSVRRNKPIHLAQNKVTQEKVTDYKVTQNTKNSIDTSKASPASFQKSLTVEIPVNDTSLITNTVPPPIKRKSITSLIPSVDEKPTTHISVVNNVPVYLGTDIHAYTHQMNQIKPSTQSDPISDMEFQSILQDMQQVYGSKAAFTNLKNVYRQGFILDPEVPHTNFALILQQLWMKLRDLNEDSAYRHFGETLDQIGMTCIQGVTHRLMIDHHAFV
jgi:hypothetical protein